MELRRISRFWGLICLRTYRWPYFPILFIIGCGLQYKPRPIYLWNRWRWSHWLIWTNSPRRSKNFSLCNQFGRKKCISDIWIIIQKRREERRAKISRNWKRWRRRWKSPNGHVFGDQWLVQKNQSSFVDLEVRHLNICRWKGSRYSRRVHCWSGYRSVHNWC